MTIAIMRRAPAGGLIHPLADKPFAGGQFIPDAVWQAEKSAAAARMPELVKSFAEDLQYHRQVFETASALRKAPDEYHVKGMLSSLQVENQIKKCIRENYRAAFLLGKRAAGNLTSTSDDDGDALKNTRLDEYKYLRQFLRDMDSGGGVMPYEKRMDYYAKASRELYWLGYVLGNPSPDRLILWTLGPKEHCQSCLRMWNNGKPWRASDLAEEAKKGILPQSGALDCLGYLCGCGLKEVTS